MNNEKQTPTTTADEQQPSAEVTELRDRRQKPEGVVPRQSQVYVVVGLAVLILLAVMFSKYQAKPPAKPSPAVPFTYSSDANHESIEALKHDMYEEQRKAEQERKEAGHSDRPASGSNGSQSSNSQNTTTTEPPRDPIKDAERALNFKSRFASNLVTANVGDNAARSPASPLQPAGLVSRASDEEAAFPLQTAGSSQPAAANTKHLPEVNVNSAQGQPYALFEGTVIEAALVNRLDGEWAGPVKVMVTNPVYSQDRQHVLVPEGTFILGEVQKVSGFGQKRLAVVFHRMLMPDGYSVDLDQFRGLDQAGETGLKDKVNNHYLQIFGTSIALGILSGAAKATTNSGNTQTGSDMWRQGVASNLSQSSVNVLDRFLNIPPTLTIREGHRIKVYLMQDLLLPAYEEHTVPPNI